MTESEELWDQTRRWLWHFHRQGTCDTATCCWCNDCPGHGRGGKREPCCARAGQFDGAAGGEYLADFDCPLGCSCHD